ncbi:hypothetical protein NIT7321_00601 [Phaeobacter italicus]|uniref:Uncharacterized protein n=1 Tax=Phaeobacter italicus TaxID=481446 RepID=A0A0H5CXP2_9RHOB|nr:hypothetical protein NIT7321_00601 [Phaeobacter italicus]
MSALISLLASLSRSVLRLRAGRWLRFLRSSLWRRVRLVLSVLVWLVLASAMLAMNSPENQEVPRNELFHP